MSSLLNTFKQRFVFNPNLTGMVGVEREAFLRTINGGVIVPESYQVCEVLKQKDMFPGCFGPELSACQIEQRTNPVRLEGLSRQLGERDLYLREVLYAMGLEPDYLEVAEATMTTEVYPEDRHQNIAVNIRPEILLAACRVTGTHVHIGMPDLPTALRVYNDVIKYTSELIMLGDGSDGERIQLYRQVSPHCDPLPITSMLHLFELAQKQGFNENLRNWWSLVRITRYGTIEFRMFGNTNSIGTVFAWASRCHKLCMSAM